MTALDLIVLGGLTLSALSCLALIFMVACVEVRSRKRDRVVPGAEHREAQARLYPSTRRRVVGCPIEDHGRRRLDL